MKTNNNPASGKRLAQLLALCLLATFSSCDRDGTESVEFGVNVQTPDAVYAGQPVTFEFDGNPDYIALLRREKRPLCQQRPYHAARSRQSRTFILRQDAICRKL